MLSLTGNKLLLNFNNRTDMTEQKSNIDESSKSPASKKRKRHSRPSDDKLQHLTTTSNISLKTDVVLNRQDLTFEKQLPTTDHQNNGKEMCNFDLPLKEDCFAPEENLEQNSANLKSSQTRGLWHKSQEENHSAWIKKRSLPGHIMCSEEALKKILESDIFCIIESEEVTEIGALYY